MMNTSSSVVTLIPYDRTPSPTRLASRAANKGAKWPLAAKGSWSTVSAPTSVSTRAVGTHACRDMSTWYGAGRVSGWPCKKDRERVDIHARHVRVASQHERERWGRGFKDLHEGVEGLGVEVRGVVLLHGHAVAHAEGLLEVERRPAATQLHPPRASKR